MNLREKGGKDAEGLTADAGDAPPRGIRPGGKLHKLDHIPLRVPGFASGFRQIALLIGGAAGFPENYIWQFDEVYSPILAELGRDVLEYATAFPIRTHPVVDGSVAIPLGEDPVLIETSSQVTCQGAQ